MKLFVTQLLLSASLAAHVKQFETAQVADERAQAATKIISPMPTNEIAKLDIDF